MDTHSDEISMLLGPMHLGYVCAGHRGSGSGRREEVSLSIHGALEDVARAVVVGEQEPFYVSNHLVLVRGCICWICCGCDLHVQFLRYSVFGTGGRVVEEVVFVRWL